MSGIIETGTILDRILARTAIDVAARKQQVARGVLEKMIASRLRTVRLSEAVARQGLGIIAEIKRASPSKGRFPVEIEVESLAAEYRTGSADAVSVLTDAPFFQGSLGDLTAAAGVLHSGANPIPVLQKDFVVDEYQIFEARAAGADAVLLIVGALSDLRLRQLMSSAETLGLEALVEVHDEIEIQRALDAGARLIGINNRDLRTFDVDLGVSERLAPLALEKAVLVGESGISTTEHARRMLDAGLDAILVGESLILADDRAAVVASLKST